MPVSALSGNWAAKYFAIGSVNQLSQINFNASPIFQETIGEIREFAGTGSFWSGGRTDNFAASYSGWFELDRQETITFYLNSDDGAELLIDGVRRIDNDGVHAAVEKTVTLTLGAGRHNLNVNYFEKTGQATLALDWKVGSGPRTSLNLEGEDPARDGQWGEVFDTTIIGIHQVLMEDGRVLYWGGDGNGNAFSNTQKYGIFDPTTGDHEILEAAHVVRMFCGAGVILPGTDKVLISGGNGSGDRGGQIFDLSDNELVYDPANEMATGRFYPTTVSLSTGQVVVFGGNGPGRATPEIFTLGEGWRTLNGATDPDVGANWWYPYAWVNKNGEILYIAINAGGQGGNPGSGPFEVMALDPSGNGSIRQVGEVPFQMDAASVAAMYDVGKLVIQDASGDLWYMDINGATPTFEFAHDFAQDRNNADMTVLADGRILINGGTITGNSQDPNNAVFQSTIFDPYTGQVTQVDSEDVMRLYHSSSVLLADGTVLSMGGGGLNGTLDFMDGQIYQPDYLFNEDGSLADRPEILSAPDTLVPGQSFTIQVDDASAIARLSFVKTGAVTHSLNMEAGRMDLDFVVLSNSTIEVTLPNNPHLVGAGNWMLFAIDADGTPSVAPIMTVLPTITEHGAGVIRGTNANDYIEGTVADETMIGNGGEDVFGVSAGNDTIIGDDAFYDQIDIDGFASDYLFIELADGSVARSGGGLGTDTLISVEGVWFRGEAAWYSIEDLVQRSGSVIIGTGAGEYLEGTSGNDLIETRGGDDVVGGSLGNDTIYGQGGDYNQVDYDGSASQYSFSRNDDGSVRVLKANGGVDTLYGIDGFWFRGEAKWYSLASLLDAPGLNIIEGTADADFLFGTAGDDDIRGRGGEDVLDGGAGNDILRGGGSEYDQVNYDGFASDFSFSRNSDGSVTVTSAAFGTDTLYDIDGFWFRNEAAWYSVDQALGLIGANGLFRGTDGADILTGTDGGEAFFGGAGNDEFSGGLGGDAFHGGSGMDLVTYKTSGAGVTVNLATGDTAGGTAAGDIFHDIENLAGSRFADTLRGDSTHNQIWGGNGGDRLFGEGGMDRLVGQNGNDRLFGQDGKDQLFGGDGDDLLSGGRGLDVLTGGAGHDQFKIGHVGKIGGKAVVADVIKDFVSGEDWIDLSAIDADLGTAGNQTFTFIGSDRFSGTAGELRLKVQSEGKAFLLADTDGDGTFDFRVKVFGDVDLSAGDFAL